MAVELCTLANQSVHIDAVTSWFCIIEKASLDYNCRGWILVCRRRGIHKFETRTRSKVKHTDGEFHRVLMVDEEKKPRHRLGADELLEETNGAVAKVVNLLSSNGLATDSVQHLTSLARALDFMVRTIHISYPCLYTNASDTYPLNSYARFLV